jgi:hypothetical protein
MAVQAEYLVIVRANTIFRSGNKLIRFHQLQTNLRNVEATFGKESNQYLDVLEIIETYMSNMVSLPKASKATSQTQISSSQPSFTNLTLRPKKRS